MARVASRAVVIEDTLYTAEEVEEAEKLRDPTHVRNYSEEEWRELLESAGLRGRARRAASRRRTTSTTGSRRTDCTGADAERVRELLAPWSSDDGTTWSDVEADRQGEEVAEPDGDHRRQRHAARRPGPDRLRGPLPRAAQPRLRHEARRRRDARARAARTSRASRSSTRSPRPSPRPARTRR